MYAPMKSTYHCTVEGGDQGRELVECLLLCLQLLFRTLNRNRQAGVERLECRPRSQAGHHVAHEASQVNLSDVKVSGMSKHSSSYVLSGGREAREDMPVEPTTRGCPSRSRRWRRLVVMVNGEELQ